VILRRGVAAQDAFEKQTLKPGFHFIGARVETRRCQTMGQLDPTCTTCTSPCHLVVVDAVDSALDDDSAGLEAT
jgi:hypothetical protein